MDAILWRRGVYFPIWSQWPRSYIHHSLWGMDCAMPDPWLPSWPNSSATAPWSMLISYLEEAMGLSWPERLVTYNVYRFCFFFLFLSFLFVCFLLRHLLRKNDNKLWPANGHLSHNRDRRKASLSFTWSSCMTLPLDETATHACTTRNVQ